MSNKKRLFLNVILPFIQVNVEILVQPVQQTITFTATFDLLPQEMVYERTAEPTLFPPKSSARSI